MEDTKYVSVTQKNNSSEEDKVEEKEDCFLTPVKYIETEHPNDCIFVENEENLLEEIKRDLDKSGMIINKGGHISPQLSPQKQKQVHFMEDEFFMKLYPVHKENKIPGVIRKSSIRSKKISKEIYLVYTIIIPFLIMAIMALYVHYFPQEYLEPKVEFSSHCGLYTGAWSHDMTVLRLFSVPYAVQPTIENTTDLARNYFRSYPLGLRWTHTKSIDGEDSCLAAHSNNCYFKKRWTCYFVKPSDVPTCSKGVMDKFYIGSHGDDACLTLNIARPSFNFAKKVPIIFLVTGFLGVYSPMQPPLYTSKSYEPDNYAVKRSGCLWVSVNYRLGINGHFLDIYNSNSTKTTDFALTDLKVALQWVKRNAKHFGADPSKITILAQGSASTLVLALIEKYKLKKDELFQQAWLSSGPVHWAANYNETYPKEIIEDLKTKYLPTYCKLENMTRFCRHELFLRTRKLLSTYLHLNYKYALDPAEILRNILELQPPKGWLSVDTVPPLMSGAPGLKKYLESGGKLVFTTMGYEFENMPDANDYGSKEVVIKSLKKLFNSAAYFSDANLTKIIEKYEEDLTIKDIFLKILSTVLYHCPKNSLLHKLQHPNAYHITYDLKLDQTYTGAQNYYAKTENAFNHTFHGIELEAITYEHAPHDIEAGVNLFFRFAKHYSLPRVCSNETVGLYGCVLTKEGLNNENFTLIHQLCSDLDTRELISVAMKY